MYRVIINGVMDDRHLKANPYLSKGNCIMVNETLYKITKRDDSNGDSILYLDLLQIHSGEYVLS